MGTAVQATRIGIVIFAIPFLFAFNPVMLIVSEAGAEFSMIPFLYLLARLGMLIYMLASAASRFDTGRMKAWEVVLRVVAGLALIHPNIMFSGAALALAIGLIVIHRALSREAQKA
jgi:TRAP-type uncharacterized transport system fused permease subunit